MAYASTGGERQRSGALSPRSVRAQMEEALGKLDISEEEATPLIIDDSDEGSSQNPRGIVIGYGRDLHGISTNTQLFSRTSRNTCNLRNWCLIGCPFGFVSLISHIISETISGGWRSRSRLIRKLS
ncbi:hypothetical protein ZWY2020_035134 [Hordeum vulgare]|nr:hypothetical protein ZWY2020_035134 [Hordeum vulgare]